MEENKKQNIKKDEIMDVLKLINNNENIVKTKNILKALNKMGMDWIKRTIRQSTIMQRIKVILITMFILQAFLSLEAPKGPDGKIRLDQIVTFQTVEINREDVNIDFISEEELSENFNYQEGDEKIIVPPSNIIKEFKKDGWFNALIVWPLSQFLNLVASITSPVLSLVILTGIFQAFLLVINTKSFKKRMLYNKVKPKVKAIKETLKQTTDKKEIRKLKKDIRNIYKENHLHPKIQAVSGYLNLPLLFGVYYAVQRAYGVIFGNFMGAPLNLSPHEGFQIGNLIIVAIYCLMAFSQFFQSSLNDILNRIYNLHAKHKKEVKTIANIAMTFLWTAFIVRIYWNWPITLSFYWLVTSCFSCTQILINHKIVNQSLKEKEQQANLSMERSNSKTI